MCHLRSHMRHFSYVMAQGEADLLSLEPPMWVPDSAAGGCSRCRARFKLLVRPRHHCRLCGQLFCGVCCARRLLLPPRFQQAVPQRVCTSCAALLDPLQAFLAGVPPVQEAQHPMILPFIAVSAGLPGVPDMHSLHTCIQQSGSCTSSLVLCHPY